jgi:hypothetical protein
MARDDTVWTAAQIDSARRAATAERGEDRMWQGRRIAHWSEWRTPLRHEAVLILDDGARYVIREQEDSPPATAERPQTGGA